MKLPGPFGPEPFKKKKLVAIVYSYTSHLVKRFRVRQKLGVPVRKQFLRAKIQK
jgi:hypothetical protein